MEERSNVSDAKSEKREEIKWEDWSFYVVKSDK